MKDTTKKIPAGAIVAGTCIPGSDREGQTITGRFLPAEDGYADEIELPHGETWEVVDVRLAAEPDPLAADPELARLTAELCETNDRGRALAVEIGARAEAIRERR